MFLLFSKAALKGGAEDGGMPSGSHRPPKHAVHQRDAGLRKVSVATRLLVAGSVAAAGLFAAMAAAAQPGRAKVSSATRQPTAPAAPAASVGSATATVPTTVPAAPASGDDGGGGDDLAPPATVPVTIPAQTPDYQYSPPSYQYSPPVVSAAS
jgi:hypothetical protein